MKRLVILWDGQRMYVLEDDGTAAGWREAIEKHQGGGGDAEDSGS